MTELGNCPLCDKVMVDGPSVDRHHLIPKSKQGKNSDLCHVVCHRKIHSTLPENDLASHWNTWDRLRDHSEIKKYIKWVRKQFNRDPEYVDVHRDTTYRRKKRRK